MALLVWHYSLVFSCTWAPFIVPGSRKSEETRVNDWITLKGRGYHKINNWNFAFRDSWDLPSLPGNEPGNSCSKMACKWRCQGTETVNSSFVIFTVNHDAWIGLSSFLMLIRRSVHPKFWGWMLLWGEERGAVEVITAGLGPSEHLSSGYRKREIREPNSTLWASSLCQNGSRITLLLASCVLPCML